MHRFLLYIALALHVSVFAATAADRYGEWLIEQSQSFVLALAFKQSVALNDKTATSELAFICDQRDKLTGVILIPFDGTFENLQVVIPVLVQKSADQLDPSDLSQNWKNGIDYIFLDSQDNVGDLASFLKTNEANGVASVHFFFPNVPQSGSQSSNHIAINVSGFSDGFDLFQMACNKSR